MGMFPTRPDRRNIGIMVIYLSALGLELFNENVARAFAVVIHISLVSDPKKKNF
jgi:hypothetical protein